jgi:hypothetical protein
MTIASEKRREGHPEHRGIPQQSGGNVRRILTLLALLASGCGSGSTDFSDWHEELAYLRAQANTTPAQFKRLRELAFREYKEMKPVTPAEFERWRELMAIYEPPRYREIYGPKVEPPAPPPEPMKIKPPAVYVLDWLTGRGK